MAEKIIIILASERSGTNLLRVLLGKHSQLSAPVAVHFFNTFKATLKYYGDLSITENAERLMRHFLNSANHPYTDWNLNADPKELVKKYKVDSIEMAFFAIYKEYSTGINKPFFVVKDNDMFKFVNWSEALKEKGIDVHYIYLYRDLRDHTVSWLKTPIFMHTSYDIAKKWNREQNSIYKLRKIVDMHFVSYENLIENTDIEITKILNYVNLEVEKNCFSTDVNNKESARNEMWKNLSQPVNKANKNKYKENLKYRDIKIIETIGRDNLIRLGYPLETQADWRDYLGLYTKFILPRIRTKNKKNNTHFYEKKMKSLESKLSLLKSFEVEVKSLNR